MLSLTAGEVASIRVVSRVDKETSGTSHVHVVSFNAA